jgi:hypothetical protein
MSSQERTFLKRRILLAAFVFLLTVLYIGVAPLAQTRATTAGEFKAPCSCWNATFQTDGVLRPNGYCDPCGH